jgi:hypothetical protein
MPCVLLDLTINENRKLPRLVSFVPFSNRAEMQIPEISHDICSNPDFIDLSERPLCANNGH